MDAVEPPAPDFAATALDRPVADMADLERAALMQGAAQDRRRREKRAHAKRVLTLVLAAALAVGLLLGVALGAYLALS